MQSGSAKKSRRESLVKRQTIVKRGTYIDSRIAQDHTRAQARLSRPENEEVSRAGARRGEFAQRILAPKVGGRGVKATSTVGSAGCAGFCPRTSARGVYVLSRNRFKERLQGTAQGAVSGLQPDRSRATGIAGRDDCPLRRLHFGRAGGDYRCRFRGFGARLPYMRTLQFRARLEFQ